MIFFLGEEKGILKDNCKNITLASQSKRDVKVSKWMDVSMRSKMIKMNAHLHVSLCILRYEGHLSTSQYWTRAESSQLDWAQRNIALWAQLRTHRNLFFVLRTKGWVEFRLGPLYRQNCSSRFLVTSLPYKLNLITSFWPL